MKLSQAIGREAVIVLAGAVLAAFIIGNVPQLREWIARQWGNEKRGASCNC